MRGEQLWLPILISDVGDLAAGYTFGSHAAVDADPAFSVLRIPLNLQQTSWHRYGELDIAAIHELVDVGVSFWWSPAHTQ